METVLIADDEKNIREGIKCIIDWEALGFTVCGEAGNGEEALKQIMALRPGLVLLDIKMPKLSGLEVVENAREQGYNGKFLILSGFSDFKYAQTAIRLGVDNYITKPIDEDELVEAVRRIGEEIKTAKENESHKEHYKKKARKEILHDLVMNRIDKSVFSPAEMNLVSSVYQVVLYENFDINEGENMPYQFSELLKVTNNGSQTFEHFMVENYNVIILKGSFAMEKFDRFLEHYESTPPQKGSPMDSLFIAYGRPVKDLFDVHISYAEAYTLIKRRFFCTQGQHTLGYEELPKMKEASESLDNSRISEYCTQITDYLQTFSRRKVAEVLYSLEEYLYNVNTSIDSVKLFLTDLFLQIKENINRIYSNNSLSFPPNSEIIEYISERRYMYEIIEYISKQLDVIMNSMGSSSRESVLDDVLHYIDHNYATNIKLEIIAALFGYNSAYLGKIFNKTVGESFNSYVDQIRINHAIELLKDNKLKVYEIAERVGYKNVDYFHKKFKKYVGVSPAEYRNKKNEE
ncbi:MAG: response regulator [Lachnospiraceae bacterium]